MNIHSTSYIDPKAKIGNNVKIGPFCIVGPDVELSDNVELKSHIVLEGYTKVGSGTVIFPFASIGTAPQDLKYSGEKSQIIIGKNNIIREYVTIQPGTTGGGMLTSVGDNNLLMLGVHIAHDCKIGNNCIFANNATLAGHVIVEDNAVLGGLAAVRQFVRIGTSAMVGGLAAVAQDVIPYATVANERATIEGVNIVGMRRQGFDLKEVQSAQNAIEVLFDKTSDNIMKDRIAEIRELYPDDNAVKIILDFVENQQTKLGYCEPKN